MRITRKDLEEAVKFLNRISRKRYGIESAYGGYQLVYFINNVDSREGVGNITYGYVSARELYNIIWAIIRYIENETRS